MSRSHLAVLISLIGSGISWHEAGLAQVTGDAPVSQAMPARDAAILSALGLGPSRDDPAALRQPSIPRPGKADPARRRSLAPAASPPPEEPRWDASALGLDRPSHRDAARGAGTASPEDGRIRSILGFGAPLPGVAPLVAARPASVPRAVARRDERVEAPATAPHPATVASAAAASPAAVSPAEMPEPTSMETHPADPDPGPVAAQAASPDPAGPMTDADDVIAALDRAAPSAYLSPLIDIDMDAAAVESIALPFRAVGPRPQPRRRSRNDPLPMIADAPSPASRRGGTGTTASLALTSDDLERAADRLRTPTRDRRDVAAAGGSADLSAALIRILPRVGDEAYDSPRRLIAAIVERTRDARIAADVFRHIASDMASMADQRIAAEATPDARGISTSPFGASSPDPHVPAGRPEPRAIARSDVAWTLLPLEAEIPEPIAAKAAFVDGLVAMPPATRPAATLVDTSVIQATAPQSEARSLAPASPFEKVVAALAACAPLQRAPLRVRVLGPGTPGASPMPFVPRASWSDAFGDAERRAAFTALAADVAAVADATAPRTLETGSRRPSVWVDVFDPALDLPRRPTRLVAPGDGSRRVVATAGLRIDPLAHRGAADHDFGAPMLVASKHLEASGSRSAATGYGVPDAGTRGNTRTDLTVDDGTHLVAWTEVQNRLQGAQVDSVRL